MRMPLSDAQERIESSDLGRVLISAFLVLTVVALLALNLPWQYETALKRELRRVAWPYSKATGIQQSWSVFAPIPRPSSLAFTARIRYADGSHVDWHPPVRDRYVGEFSSEHWVKWIESAVRDDNKRVVGRPAAIWLARKYAQGGRRPVEVTFVRTWRDTPPLASHKKPRPRREVYFHLRITPQMLGGGT
jgi:hypothetical protein